jgi:hypothetical protein
MALGSLIIIPLCIFIDIATALNVNQICTGGNFWMVTFFVRARRLRRPVFDPERPFRPEHILTYGAEMCVISLPLRSQGGS